MNNALQQHAKALLNISSSSSEDFSNYKSCDFINYLLARSINKAVSP